MRPDWVLSHFLGDVLCAGLNSLVEEQNADRHLHTRWSLDKMVASLLDHHSTIPAMTVLPNPRRPRFHSCYTAAVYRFLSRRFLVGEATIG
jgi:hypothetical protein